MILQCKNMILLKIVFKYLTQKTSLEILKIYSCYVKKDKMGIVSHVFKISYLQDSIFYSVNFFSLNFNRCLKINIYRGILCITLSVFKVSLPYYRSFNDLHQSEKRVVILANCETLIHFFLF